MRRAFLVGSATYGLRGCDADVALMSGLLGDLGWDEVITRTGPDAGRAKVLAGLTALGDGIGPQDAVLVYFSGHGGRVARRDWKERRRVGLPVYYQFIVTAEPPPGEFQGIFAEELAL